MKWFGPVIAIVQLMKNNTRFITFACLAFMGGASLWGDTVDERLQDSAGIVRDLLLIPERGIPADLLDAAHCVVVVPGMKKAAFVVGVRYGRGFAVCRHDNLAGWGSPAAMRIEGGSFGFQVGASETDLVMLIMNRSGMKKLLQSKFTLGGAAEVAAGPIGRDSTALTDAKMTAKILSWSRSRGAFAGISLQGATLRQDLDQNQELYGRRYSNREILMKNIAVPRAASELLAVLNHNSGRP